MNKILLTLTLLAGAASLLLSGKSASAQVELDFQQPVLSGAAGNTFQFFGTITNYGSSAVFLTGDTFTPLSLGLTLNDSPSFNIPATLSSFGTGTYSYTGELFDVITDPGVTPDSYSGTFSLTGGADPIVNDFDTLVTKHFGVVTTAAVPEASTTVSLGLLMTLGLGGLAFTTHKKKAASAG